MRSSGPVSISAFCKSFLASSYSSHWRCLRAAPFNMSLRLSQAFFTDELSGPCRSIRSSSACSKSRIASSVLPCRCRCCALWVASSIPSIPTRTCSIENKEMGVVFRGVVFKAHALYSVASNVVVARVVKVSPRRRTSILVGSTEKRTKKRDEFKKPKILPHSVW